MYANERRVRFTEMEYAIPREHAAEALERVLALIERRRLPVGFPIELRVVAPDDAFLSTAHGRPTAYIAVHQYRGMEFETYFRAVERIMDDYDGRPHWGKRHYQTRPHARPALPGLGALPGGAARASTPRGASPTTTRDRVLGLDAVVRAQLRAGSRPEAADRPVERRPPGRRACAPARAASPGRHGAERGARRSRLRRVAVGSSLARARSRETRAVQPRTRSRTRRARPAGARRRSSSKPRQSPGQLPATDA